MHKPTTSESPIDATQVSAANAVARRGQDRRVTVELDQDHPGFRDAAYRARRDLIASIALDHAPGAPVPDAPYTAEEDALWRQILEALAPAHARRACPTFRRSWATLELPRARIPQLSEVSALLDARTGYRFEPVSGLVHPRVFLEALAEGVMLCTQYIRHHTRPHYTPEPDVVHELVGHAPMFADARFAALSRRFGAAARRADDAQIEGLIRLYWYSVEFGVVGAEGERRAFGAGLLSSLGELEGMGAVTLRPFEPAVMSATDFDPTAFQPFLFCAPDEDALYHALDAHLGRIGR